MKRRKQSRWGERKAKGTEGIKSNSGEVGDYLTSFKRRELAVGI